MIKKDYQTIVKQIDKILLCLLLLQSLLFYQTIINRNDAKNDFVVMKLRILIIS